MALSNTQLAAQDYAVQDISTSVAVVEALERQLQTQPAIETEQVQACQLEPGDRVLYNERLMRVGSIQPSTARPWGFFVSLLPADYRNPYTDYKRWQAHLRQHKLEIPANWFAPWQRVQPQPVELPYNPFKAEPQGNTTTVKAPLLFNEPDEDGIQSEPEAARNYYSRGVESRGLGQVS